MAKVEVLKKINEAGVVAVVRGDSEEQAIKTVEAVVSGGIKIIELTMTVTHATVVIRTLADKYKGTEVVIGAGTVLDSETARQCILEGAEFIVSPCLDVNTIKLCNRYKVAVMPGVTTVKDAVEALDYGVDIIKVFPSNLFGPAIIGAFKGPLPQADFMPTGGVSVENMHQWIKSGAKVVGVGGELTKGAKTNNYELVEETARLFVNEYNRIKLEESN